MLDRFFAVAEAALVKVRIASSAQLDVLSWKQQLSEALADFPTYAKRRRRKPPKRFPTTAPWRLSWRMVSEKRPKLSASVLLYYSWLTLVSHTEADCSKFAFDFYWNDIQTSLAGVPHNS